MSRNPSVIILTAHKRFACFILHSAAHFSFSLLRKFFENLNISEIVYYKSCQNISERMFQQLFSCCKCDDEGILHMRKIEISRFHQMSTHFELMSECVSSHNLIWTAELTTFYDQFQECHDEKEYHLISIDVEVDACC